jgi:mono/diheme cytochrome c family protein
MRHLLPLLLAAACAGSPPAPKVAPPAPPRPAEVPISDPAEYGIERITREAGRAIFERTGVGDPYRTGIPYPIFLALLDGFPATFGASPAELAERFGFLARAPDPASADLDVREGLPVGMHLTTDPITGVPFVVNNCSLCHAERLRWPGGEALVVGLGNKRVRIHAYDRAFSAIVAQPGFTAKRLARLAGAAAARRGIAWPDRYADAMAGAAFAALRQRAADRAELHERTRGDPPGRVAVMESFAIALRRLADRPVALAPAVGWAKVPDVIGFRARTTLSWDGSQEGPIDLLVVEADLAAGARVEWLERHPFQGASLGAYLRQPAPRPAFPGRIDRRLVERGRALFAQHCSDCHGSYREDGGVLSYDEAVVAIEDVGTDAARLLAATESFERAANDPALTRGYTRFRRSAGYVAPVLTNVWARAPYGHAAQWPSLAVLATSPEKRAPRLLVDLDAPYDLAAVGVATRAPLPTSTPQSPNAYIHDAAKPGFSVGGHPFLADLGTEAVAVIEYLKTL